MLIGMDRQEMLKPLQIVDGPWNSAYASLHRLGWAINGSPGPSERKNIVNHRITTTNKEDIEEQSQRIV